MGVEEMAIQQMELDRLGRVQREDDDEDESEHAAEAIRTVGCSCQGCGETDQVMAPKGYRFARLDEVETGLRSLRYRCRDCGEVNRVQATLAQESEAVATFREAYRRKE